MPRNKAPAARSPQAKDLSTTKYHQRVIPDKRRWPNTKREEEDRAWAEHADWKKREGVN
jgi:hypothetical protein